MSVDNQKLLQKIVEELDSLKGETEILSIAVSCLFSELPTDSASNVRAKFTKSVNELKTAAAASRRRSRRDVYSKALSMMTKPE